ncbi:MAG: bifunctional phosphopantothenoylcysteine decarboxylase/phosphopantothenate--cysteine ligase CoaBC [Bacteroidetes bacterium]|nr:MAG: bifunctional phosphopantothenoylcysteine decarboxylase/phosphopantothenate--cysteine ligase CoaBC [Bacteroidota bacterium]
MRGKRVLLGITGGIAAYKIAGLIRLLRKEGADVKCIMTPASCDFISPLTIATLSEHPVQIEFWDRRNGSWTNHVDLGLWPDLFLITPLTANTLAKLAHGYADNLLTATYLSARCPVMIAPAMDLDMYAHLTTTENLERLRGHGVRVLEAQYGELASGLVGQGRMMEPEDQLKEVKNFFQGAHDLEGKRVLITAGPTYEKIDPVRFIGNHSSGKMGYRLAESALRRGAEVILVSGPSAQRLEHPALQLIRVESALEMLEEVKKQWEQCDLGIFAAAVADYRPAEATDQKIKKKEDEMSIRLVKNPDILAWAGSVKKESQFLVGFALETNDAVRHAEEKRARKNLDLIVLNTLEEAGSGFQVDTNRVHLIDRNNKLTSFELKEKSVVAEDIIEFIKSRL